MGFDQSGRLKTVWRSRVVWRSRLVWKRESGVVALEGGEEGSESRYFDSIRSVLLRRMKIVEYDQEQ